MTLLVTVDSDGRIHEVVYCDSHLATAVQNLGAFRVGDCAYRANEKAPCEVCAHLVPQVSEASS